MARAVFYGLGADGTVGANKNSIKIIGEETDQLRPGLLRLRLEEVGGDRRSRTCASARGPSARPTSSRSASFVACHQFEFLDKFDVLEHAAPGAVFLLNAPYGPRTRSGTTCRARCRSRSSRSGSGSS